MKRYDPGLEGPCAGLEQVVMEESPYGEYVRLEDAQRLMLALGKIAEILAAAGVSTHPDKNGMCDRCGRVRCGP